uniref:Uncharacterized protein n=1 Tax=Ursus maritimus TaxID=29073 RepID=A0A452USA3_URSMA
MVRYIFLCGFSLVLYPATLLNYSRTSNSLGVDSFGFSILFMSSTKRNSLTSSLSIWVPFIPFCCLIAVARTSSTMLNNSGESGHPCRVPVLKGKASGFSPLRIIFAVGFSEMAFMCLRNVPSIPTL